MGNELYLHVLDSNTATWLIDVFRQGRPGCGPLAEDAAFAVRRCPSLWLGWHADTIAPGFGGLFADTFGYVSPYEGQQHGQHDAHVRTWVEDRDYAKRLERYHLDIAAGRPRVAPVAPPVPRWARAPTFAEALREEIGPNYVVATKRLARLLVQSYPGGGVTAEALENFLRAHVGATIFQVAWTAP